MTLLEKRIRLATLLAVVVAMALVRDIYAGREMARIMSFVMIVFALVPALAPSMGAAIIALSDWRGIFVTFMAFAAIATLWLSVRITLAVARRLGG